MSSVIEGDYCYDPNTRYMMQREQMQYQQNMYSPDPMMGYGQPQGFMNPPADPGQGYHNPAFDMIRNSPTLSQQFGLPYQGYQMSQEYEDRTVFVPGFNPGGDMLLPSNAEDICDKMQIDMMMEQEEAIVQREKRFQGYFNNNYGQNYYGMPYMTNYYDSGVMMKYRNKISIMKQEAIERRTNFNKRLSRMVHGYLEDDYTDEKIDEIYAGQTYTIPGAIVQRDENYIRLANMVPVSNAGMYQEYEMEISNQYKRLVGDNPNMQEWLEGLGVVHSYELLEQAYHQRRDASQYYNSDSYHRLLRRSIAERDGKPAENIPMGDNFPTLNQSASLLDDGTLSITLPPWMKDKTSGADSIQITNELESHFEENRARFLESIYNLGQGGDASGTG